ncbi:glycogen synthase [Rhodohalobacter sp. 614A]|uniref:glycogen synthase n=1 Tax=Rhodohalobacter sp. 614A TaxID=2908649 RepID=UPI001F2C0118|nr:glycogen synthase [Rhodohalobacter sp. 614A]
MHIVHISAECYPIAKAGGLGDVVGALPKYLNQAGETAKVILPHYYNSWMEKAETELLLEERAPFGQASFAYRVSKLIQPDLGFELFLIDIPGRFDRPGVYLDPWSGYAYWDEKERFFSFQIAALDWINQQENIPDIVHCHDHHTALVPFMMTQSYRYEKLKHVPTVLTIHNGEYQGRYDMDSTALLPDFDHYKIGLLDWDETLNSLAAGIKTAWKVTTVSEGYMDELQEYCHGLEHLLRAESEKTLGILNGIDSEIWDPATDNYLEDHYSAKNYKSGKKKNKEKLCEHFSLTPEKPLFSFIGRLVREKGADLLPDLIKKSHSEGIDANFIVLGTGEPSLHSVFENLQNEYTGYFDSRLEYNEGLAHLIYAGSDFLLMPSRVEPCGLNQLYSMRYGTIPVVRKTGGLADTVKDVQEEDGYGFVFGEFNLQEAFEAVERAVEIFNKKRLFDNKRRHVMNLDFSWKKAAQNYISMYKSMKG